ncbi:MAG TPA: hypothetical protein ENJ37_06645 [Deltaproteobacteria bacterium]|nr:hypothetical protein [Deltaproteobacteria bacterium]
MSDVKQAKSFYEIPQEIIDDIDVYAAEVEKVLRGEISRERFKPFRVTRGVYAQRGQTTHMMRIRVPAGGLLPEQMRRIADLSERYGNGIPHVTTRQDVQLHRVVLEDTVKAMRSLAEVGLSTRGGGGNTLRNVTACPESGVCPRESFDVAPYAVAVTEALLTHPSAYSLPRKYKIAFSGCAEDCALATINDVGFVAVRRGRGGAAEEGFQVWAAGGMGAWSRPATLIEEFIPADQALAVAEAVMNLFDKHGNRRNKHKARLRFVIEKYGERKFLDLYRRELDAVRSSGPRPMALRPVPRLRDVGAVEAGEPPAGFDERGFELWRASNVREQKQPGFHYARIRLELGDIEAPVLRRLADVVERFGEGTLRTGHDQNLMIRWLREEELRPLFAALAELGLGRAGAGRIDDVLCCPGASTCNLGICLSRNMAAELTRELCGGGLDLGSLDVDIKISGCPNACGQHPVGAIGLYGAAKRGDGRLAPHYEVLAGGRVEAGKTRLAETYGFVPAKRIPAFVTELLGRYAAERGEGGFHDYLDGGGRAVVRELVERYSTMPPHDEAPQMYTDWGVDEEFSLAGLGPGECGAGVFDIIDVDIEEAEGSLAGARRALAQGRLEEASEAAYRGLVATCKALLITQGIETASDEEAVDHFESKFIGRGLVPERFAGLDRTAELLSSRLLNERGLDEYLGRIEAMLDRVKALYSSMDDFFHFRLERIEGEKGGEGEAPAPESRQAPGGAEDEGGAGPVLMDLRGVKCPINYVKAKIKLETMKKGEELLLYLDEGEPIRNVPSSLRNDGQEILRMEKTGDHYELLVKKAV